MNWGPLLTTGGNLLFGGGTNDREFHAFDASTGKLLWQFPAPSGVTGVPSSFEIDGEQYIAVLSGWGSMPSACKGPSTPCCRTRPSCPRAAR